MNKIELEVCVDTVHSAIAAERGGADRVELCAALSEGGLTPSWALIEHSRKHLNIALHVLIRPRRGDFLYSDLEFEIMKKDIEMARTLGADGVVLGVLHEDGQLDVERIRILVAHAAPLSITFHRAFDMTPDPFQALEELKELQVDRLLTSGQRSTALAGAGLIRDLVKAAGNQLVVMPGGGINEDNVAELRKETGAWAYHASARSSFKSKMDYKNQNLSMGSNLVLSEYEYLEANPDVICRMRKALSA
jgi:copper homeostasis protein